MALNQIDHKTNIRPWQTKMRALTVLRDHSEGDDVAGILDKLDDVIVRQLDDGAPVDRRDTISDVQQATAVGGTAFNNAANLVRNN